MYKRQHVFNYPPIQVNVKGTIGINTSHPENYHAIVNPIVRGSITSINVEKPGLGYGNDTTFNLVFHLKFVSLLGHHQNTKLS